MTLFEYRILAKITRQQAATELQTDVVNIWRWEKKGVIPDTDKMRQVWRWSKGAVTPNDFILRKGVNS